MNYRGAVYATVRTGASNLVGVAIASIAVNLTLLPFVATASFGALPAVVGGLWTTCLSLGVALVGLSRFATEVAERGVTVSALPHFAAAVKRPTVGLKLGGATFGVVLAALASGLAPDSVRPLAVGSASFLLACWYLLVALAVPDFGDGAPLGRALRAGAARFGRSPLAAGLLLLLSLVATAIAGVTVVTLLLFLPGTLGLLTAHVASGISPPSGRREGSADGEQEPR